MLAAAGRWTITTDEGSVAGFCLVAVGVARTEVRKGSAVRVRVVVVREEVVSKNECYYLYDVN